MSPSAFRPLVGVKERAETPVAWEPDPLLFGRAGASSPRTDRTDSIRAESEPSFEQLDLTGPESEQTPASGAEADTGKGVPFEELPMEWLTGAPRIEYEVAQFGDGFEFEPELLPEAEDSDPDTDPAEEGLDGDDSDAPGSGMSEDPQDDGSLVDPTNSGDEGGAPDALRGASDDAPVAESVAEMADAVPEEEQFVGPPIPMIRESEHLAQLESVRQSTREFVWAEAHRKGFEEGAAKTRRALEAELASERAALAALMDSIRVAALDPIALHAPLRRLAVHLAMELVRGELSISSDAIGRLIETCLAEIDRAPGDHLVLALHPDDMQRWVTQPAVSLDRVELRSDPAVGPGSVRLSAGDTVIEDLLDHRLSSIATRVLGEGGAQRLPRLGALRSRGFAEGDISDVG